MIFSTCKYPGFLCFMQLINTKIIPDSQNIYWEALPAEWQSLNERICIVLTLPYAPGSNEEQTLLKMLGACKLAADQFHILTLQPEQKVAWHLLRETLKPKYALLLGINPQSLGISALFRLNEANDFNECRIIPSLPLEQLIQMQDMRTALWQNGLKPVFVP